MNMTKPGIEILLDGARGIYLPRDFAEGMDRNCVSGVSAEDWTILEAGPDHEHYWEAWTDVLDNATATDPTTGVVYRFEQDGDLFAIPEGMEWDDCAGGYVWPEEGEK
jgi:hypothetical protein